MTEDEAREQLRRLVAADTFPTLDAFELRDLLRMARRPDYRGYYDVDVPDDPLYPRTVTEGLYPVWAPSTVYALDDRVVPTIRNGRVYKVTVAGTSGEIAPAFPDTLAGTVTDGEVTWTEVTAPVWMPTYDINVAAAEGWRWKAGRVTDRVSFGSQGDNYNAEQVYLHCLEMAKYYQSRIIGSAQVVTGRTAPVYTGLPRAN